MKKKGNVLLKDIAAELNLPISTVSHALRNYNDISDEMKQKVWKKAKEMGYIPNNLATFLKNKKTNYIAIIFNSLENPYFSVMCERLIKCFRSRGYEAFIFLHDSLYLTWKELEVPILNRCCAVVSFIECTEEASNLSANRNFPILLLGMNSNFDNISCIINDDYNGGEQVAEYCIKNDLKKLLYVGNNYTETSLRRREGFINKLKEHNKNSDIFLYGYAEDYEDYIADRIINEEYDFVFFYNDEAAINIKHLLLKKGYNVDKLKFVGYDNLTNYFSICEKMDSVSFNFNDIAEETCNILIDMVENDEVKGIKKVFPVKLITY